MSFHAEVIFAAKPALVQVSKEPTDEVLDTYIPAYGIDDARRLKSQAYQTAVRVGCQRLFIVRTESITEQAQQALLKLLEEPPHTTRVVFVCRSGITMLPTVLSRCQVSYAPLEKEKELFTEFLSLSYADRLTLIEARHTKKDTEWFITFQAGLGAWLTEGQRGVPPHVCEAYTLLGTRGASNKLLSEHIALSLPIKP